MFALFYHWIVLTTLVSNPQLPRWEMCSGRNSGSWPRSQSMYKGELGLLSRHLQPSSSPPFPSHEQRWIFGGGGCRWEMSLMKACRCEINPIQIHRNTQVDPWAQPSSCWWISSNTSPGRVPCCWLQSWRLLWLALGDPWGIWVSLMRCLACSS